MNEAERIRELYRKYGQYMIDKDAEGLRGLMASDYYLLHMTGGKHSWRLRGDFTLRNEQGVWKLTGSHASTY